jgi:hypothetical protein
MTDPELKQILEHIDATLAHLGQQIAAGTEASAGFTEWAAKADADYTRVLA